MNIKKLFVISYKNSAIFKIFFTNGIGIRNNLVYKTKENHHSLQTVMLSKGITSIIGF